MSRLFLAPYRRLKAGFALATIGLVLVVSQIVWSSPPTVSPQTLATQVTADEAPFLLDVRSAREFAEGHIPGAVNMPYREIPERLDELQPWADKPIIIYCEVGIRAGIAEAVLEQTGFEQILMLEGHMQAWRQVGLPIDKASPVSTP